MAQGVLAGKRKEERDAAVEEIIFSLQTIRVALERWESLTDPSWYQIAQLQEYDERLTAIAWQMQEAKDG